MRSSLRSVRGVLVTLGSLACVPSVTQGQTYGCVPETSVQATTLKDYLVRLVTASSGSELDTVRVRYQLPAGQASSVVYQKQKQLCTQIAQAYHNIVQPGAPQVSRNVVVFKVGMNRYVAFDPAWQFGEFKYHVVFDINLVKVAAFTG